MSILPITKYPSKILRQKAKKIKDPLAPEIQKLIQDMVETLRKAQGLGLAAPQAGKSVRLCVVEFEGKLYVLINPKIINFSKSKIIMEEGCLSFPKKFLPVERPEKAKVMYLDKTGKRSKIKADGILARIIQHEIDHLNGILIIDKVKKFLSKG